MTDPTSPVIVRLPQALAEHAGGDRVVAIDVGPAMSLGGILDLLAERAPGVGRRVRDETGAIRRFVNVYVGDDECRTLGGLGTSVPAGTVVYVIPSVAGGRD